MRVDGQPVLFLVGNDYHLGDLLWLTPVLARYRALKRPCGLIVGLPDRDISRIFEHSPPVDRVVYGMPRRILDIVLGEFGHSVKIEDLRMGPVAIRMIQDWRRKLPWTYYRDLWVQPRGQWLSTFLGLGHLTELKPQIQLTADDFNRRSLIPSPYILLAPHIGSYSLPGVSYLWRRLKGWDVESWAVLARLLEDSGYTVMTVGARGQGIIRGTLPALGLPIRQVAALVDGASALVTGESGLWFVAAALDTPFAIVPWWLPRSIDWPAAMNVRYRLVSRETSPARVSGLVQQLINHEA
jgi:Glycosyltransferase family 9 (heptosyltransferase)